MVPARIEIRIALCESQYGTQNQKRKEDALRRVDNDTHPCTPEARAGIRQKERTTNDAFDDAPGLVKMVKAKEHTACQSVPPAKYSLHLRKKDASEQELLSQY